MKIFFFESGRAVYIAVAHGVLFDSEDAFYDAYPDKKIEISAMGYHDKSFCKDEIFEVWDITEDRRFLGKVVKVTNVEKFKTSLANWAEKYAALPEYHEIKEVISSMS